jgi:hypothetical protein
VARQPSPDEPTGLDETGVVAEPDDETDSDADGSPASPGDRSLWTQTRIDPVEIALPTGVGLTLRAYRLSTELTPTDVDDRDEEDPFTRPRRPEEVDEADEVEDEFEELAAGEPEPGPGRGRAADVTPGDGEPDEEEEEDEDVADEEEEPVAEEVPVFLSHRGKLLLFKSPESLVSFVRSGAPHDMAQLDTWADLVERIEPADIVPLEEDSYELDLVVENLRGGHDAWDAPLLIKAGEVARDLAYALRLRSVLEMLSPGSSLDDLDEALRASLNGGVGGFLGRRRLRRIGAQTASLGWRTIIGKISAVVDWRD